MADVKEYRYKVRGQNALITHNFEDYTEGDEITLPKHVAVNFKNQLEPLESGAEFEGVAVSPTARHIASLPAHERQQIYTERKAQLEAELDAREKELAEIDAELKKIEAAQKPASPAPAKTTEKPATPVAKK